MNTTDESPSAATRARRLLGLLVTGVALALTGGCHGDVLDRELMVVMDRLALAPLTRPAAPDHDLVRLGEALFYDKELGGNRDVACATCHHPAEHSADGLSLSVGTGGEGLGSRRSLGVGRRLVARHASDLFNRGAREWTSMFWDGRVERIRPGSIESPAGTALPEGLSGVLAAQAMFPVTARDEMRGAMGDSDVFGAPNEIAAIPDEDLRAIWDGLMRRLMHIDGYRELFAAAYPELLVGAAGFQHAANAIAAYEADAFWFADTPWDAYLAGDRTALTPEAKRGALIFFGRGRCATCHAGPLFTDLRFHNVGVPQLGPGKAPLGRMDDGRALVTGRDGDRCAFRTPSLRNVTLTGPWMHDGAYTDLDAAVRHMADPSLGFKGYDPGQLRPALRGMLLPESEGKAILTTLDPVVAEGCGLVPGDIADLVAFLEALTDPAAADLTHLVPERVPSGLPVDGVGLRRP
ncbi:MAG: cytochrome c peroxidase [Gemmatimonadota bacterium]|jgi:cytochrome c peroxidase